MIASDLVDRSNSLSDRLVPRAPCSTRRSIDIAVVDRWCADYARSRDVALRERIAAAHEWLVWLSARKMRRRDESLDDLVQVATIGLLNAIDRFDPAFGVSFHTYASSTINGELRRHYRGTWRVRVPRRLQERHLALNQAMEHLTAQLRRTPTSRELAEWVGIDVDEVGEAMIIGTASWVSELAEPDAVIDQDARLDDRLLARQLLEHLSSRERAILTAWLVDGLTQEEVGRRFGLTQVQVSRSTRRSLRTLRALVEPRPAGTTCRACPQPNRGN